MTEAVELSAPEALVLLSLPRYDGRQALKLGFMGLVAQGVLRLDTEDRPGLLRTRRIPHLTVAPGLPANLPPIAASLVGVVRAAAPGGLMKDVVKQSMREYGKQLAGFVQNHVRPMLVGRGLAEIRQSRLLGIIPLARYFRTPAGEAEKIRIEGAVRNAKTIPQLLKNDPAQAAVLVAAAGAAILLVEELRPHYDALSRALRGSDGGGFYSADGGGFGDGGSGFAGLDFGGLDFGGVDFSCFDSGAFASFDAGFSDAGGGGDGGGSAGC